MNASPLLSTTMSPNIFKKSFFQGWNFENLGSFHAPIHLSRQDQFLLEINANGNSTTIRYFR
jgi:hypothetical protein